MLCTRIILLSSFVTYFFCICHSGSFPILQLSGFDSMALYTGICSTLGISVACICIFTVFQIRVWGVSMILQYYIWGQHVSMYTQYSIFTE